MKMRLLAFTATLALAGQALVASAADMTVSVKDNAGKPVAFAVVTYTPQAGAAVTAAQTKATYVMTQKNIQFNPFVLAVPVGATVNFPNADRVNHHVYSFSPVQPFQFPLYGQGKSRALRFDKEGTVALGCNIHDSMSAYIRVVSTPYFATTDASGTVTLKGLPDSSGTLAVWQPLMDGATHQMTRTLSASAGAQTFKVNVRPMAPMAGMY